MLVKKEMEGVVSNAFYKPNTREENYRSFFDRDMEEYSVLFQYDVDKEGKLVVTKRED